MGIILDGEYTHEWAADNWYGPGSVSIKVDVNFKKIFMI